MEDPSTLDSRIISGLEQQSEDWFIARAGRPTASQASRIFTPTGKDASAQSWKNYAIELAMEREYPAHMEGDFFGNKHTDRGNDMEPHAIKAFEDKTGMSVENVGFVLRSDKIVGCSPDGLIKNDGEWSAGLEAKSPLAKNHGLYAMEGGLPAQYRPQVHFSMAVTGLKSWFFVSYLHDRDPYIYKQDWDDYTTGLADALDRFVIYYSEIRKQLTEKKIIKS